MESRNICPGFLNKNNVGFVVEYRGDFEGDIKKLDYACGTAITNTLGIVSIPEERLDSLLKDVPSIIFIEASGVYTLQDISPSKIEGIVGVKNNKYLNLNGRGVLVGVIDTGIDYLNREFMREDDTTRIARLWDQTINEGGDNKLYIGKEYTSEDINKAIQANNSGGNPYDIVPSKDTIGHGTQMASIIGARGYNKEIEGIANDCDFCIVKLFEAPFLKNILALNGIPPIPVYNNTEILAAIEYIRKVGVELNKPIVVFIGVGSQEGSHDGYNITASYLTQISSKPGVIIVTGTGNSGDYEGHMTGHVTKDNNEVQAELVISKAMKRFTLYIWVQRPNRMSLEIISPDGSSSGEIYPDIFIFQERKFYLSNTTLHIRGNDPDFLTGHQLFTLFFFDIVPGIWKFNLKGMFIINGRFDIWLANEGILPEGTKFLNSNPYNTLTIPSTAINIITVAYYNGINGAIVSESGKGFNTNQLINPDIATIGTNVLTTSLDRNRVVSVSGSSVATAIVAGSCALLLQWGIVDRNDTTLYSTKLRSLLIYAADRNRNEDYPNEDFGYGRFNLANVFQIMSGNYRSNTNNLDKYSGLYFRVPKFLFNDKYYKEDWGIINDGKST